MQPSKLTDKAEQLNLRFAALPAKSVLKALLADDLLGPTALVSSFGAEAAVLLHMASEVAPGAPVLFLDTELLFDETLHYQQALTAELGLTNVQILKGDTARDPYNALHLSDPDACCTLRKTAPLQAALTPYKGWITGRKRFQGGQRSALPLFEAEHGTGRIKVNPLASWSRAQIAAYFSAHALPRHPLTAKGYASIGCAPCTAPSASRAGRWHGTGKTECGIHLTQGATP